MDPGTAAILTLSTITGISGYGAYKLNAKRGASIDEEVKKAIGDAQALIKSAQDAKLIAEQERNKKEEEVKKLSAEISKMQKAQQQLLDEKVVLSKNLESATELEKTYRELSPEVFKQAINDFKSKPEIEKLGHPELFEPLLSRFSVTRGTARALYAKFESVVTPMMPKAEFDALLLGTLKNGRTSLEQRKKKEAEEAQEAKAKSDAEAQAAKEKAAAAAKVRAAAKAKAAAEAQAARDVAAAEAAAQAAELRRASMEKATADAAARKAARKAAADAKAAADKAAADKAAADAKAAAEAKAAADAQAAAPEPEPQDRAVDPIEINKCKQTLRSLGIRDLSSYRKWSRDNKNDPRFAEVNNCADIVLKNRTGGMRKKKLRTRRGGKQNDRRTRRG